MKINPYLGFKGECEEAFNFYARCLGGKITAKVTYGETPVADQIPSEWHSKIIHAAMQAGDDILMGGDPLTDSYVEPKGFSLSVTTEDPEKAERLFTALAENGEIRMPLQKTFFADQFGMLVDQFGIPWMILYRNGT